jgi:hypothetical protein
MAFKVGGVVGLLCALLGWTLLGLSALAALAVYLGVAIAFGGSLIAVHVLRDTSLDCDLQRL